MRFHRARAWIGVSAGAAGCRRGLAVTAGFSLAWASAAFGTESNDLFERRIRPLLVAKCQECHGEEVAEAGLRLDTPAGLRAGSDVGPVVVPGKAAESRLLAAVKHAGEVAMPPDEKLSADEIAWLETWIADGAQWEEPEGTAEPVPLDRKGQMSARIAAARAEHWSFAPPVRHEPPVVAGVPGRIDRFIAAGLAEAGAALAPPAEPRSLVRRLWFDLAGLPPRPPPRMTIASLSTACSPAPSTRSTGAASGSTSPATPTRRATAATSIAPAIPSPGPIATGWWRAWPPTCPSTGS